MTVWDIVNQFTDDNFTLIVFDLATETELYHGDAGDVYYDEVGELPVVSVDPPARAWEVTLNVDTGVQTLKYNEEYTEA